MANIDILQNVIIGAKKSFLSAKNDSVMFEREAGFAMQILKANNYLAGLDPDSIRDSIISVALTGLTLNPALKYAYLIPRGGKCTLDISYVGMIKVLTDAGVVKNVDADIVYQNDEFQYQKGDNPFLKHVPNYKVNRGNKIGAYAIAYFRGGGSQVAFMTVEELEKVMSTSESLKNENTKKFSPWMNWREEMEKKTVLKRLFKLLPKTQLSENLVRFLTNEESNDRSDYSNTNNHDKYAQMFEEAEVIHDASPQKTEEQIRAEYEEELKKKESK